MEFVASRSLLVDARYHSEEVMWGRVKCIISTVIWAFGWVMGNRRVRLEAPIREYLEAVDAVSVSCICGMSTCESCRGCASSADKDMAETEQDVAWRIKRYQARMTASNSPQRKTECGPGGICKDAGDFLGQHEDAPEEPGGHRERGLRPSEDGPGLGQRRSQGELCLQPASSCVSICSFFSSTSLSSMADLTSMADTTKDAISSLTRRVPSVMDLTTYGDANYWKISNDWLESRGCMASSASN